MTEYDYKRSTAEERARHAAACTWEEWHAYVCDISEAPSWITGNDTGLCCHSHGLILVDERAPEFPAEYEFACIGAITCNPMVDEHGRECERVNDEARAEFYFALAAEQYAAAVDALVDDVLKSNGWER